MRTRLALALAIAVAATTGCSPAAGSPTPPGTPPASPGTGLSTAAIETGGPPERLVIWLPLSFSPTSGSAAAELLAARLSEFENSNPGLTVVVRVKQASGPAGLLESLTAASQAAPSALPDLVALGPVALHEAALKGLIVALSGLDPAPDTEALYPWAAETVLADGLLIAYPFAAEAEALAYRIDSYPRPPAAWSDLLDGPMPVLFPAADPTAAFTLAQYLSLGGRLVSDEGRPSLDVEILSHVLEFYDSGHRAGVLPLAVRQYADAAATWTVLRDGRAQAAIAPFTSFLVEADLSTDALQPIPTRSGGGVCLTDTWSWALAARQPARQAVALRLLAWLTEPEFLAQWTQALGLLPPSNAALALWPEGPGTAMANRLVTVARPRPTAEILATFGPALRAAVDDVLSGAATPAAAAQAAAEAVRTP